MVELVAVVHGNEQHLFTEIGGHLHQLRDLLDTGSTPICPEVEHDDTPAKIGEGDFVARGVLFESRRAGRAPQQSVDQQR